jgi:hypothetical protein
MIPGVRALEASVDWRPGVSHVLSPIRQLLDACVCLRGCIAPHLFALPRPNLAIALALETAESVRLLFMGGLVRRNYCLRGCASHPGESQVALT